jgi:signal transduction histidine kinase
MPQPGSQAAALAYLPHWWQEPADASALDLLLAGWVRACGFKAAGIVSPEANFAKSAPAAAHTDLNNLATIVDRLRAGEPTLVVSLPGGSSRVYAPVAAPGRPLALVWAERPVGQTWSETDHAYLGLTAKALERSPALAAAIGPAIDTERLIQRLTDAAVLAGRMAHDFDNILTGILGFADLTVPMLPEGSQPASYVAEIAKVGQRGIAFTQQLHTLNRGGDPKPTPGSVAATLGREEARLRAIAPPTVRMEKDLPANLPAVAIDAAPLQTALGHLFENAVEACAKSGTVRVSAAVVDLTDSDARGFLGRVSHGAHVVVSIADTGAGIKPEVRKRLFLEPFLTTKVRHRGLGLATAFRIIAAHRGGIALDAAPVGTIARVALPLAVARPSVSVPTPPPAQHAGLREDAVRPTATTARG